MKRLSNVISSIYFFLQIYSFFGSVLLAFSVITIWSALEEIIESVGIFERATLGLDITSNYLYFSFDTFGVAIALFILLYFLIFTCQVLFIREKLRRVLRRNQYTFDQKGNNLVLTFDNQPKTGFFFLHAKLKLENISAGKFTVEYGLQPRAFLLGKDLNFSLSGLPTAKYNIKSCIFYMKGPFGLFDATIRLKSDKLSKVIVCRHNFIQQGAFRKADIDQEKKLVLSPLGSQDYFSVREYRWGDELRRIHWKNTAKLRKLIVKHPESKPISDEKINIILNLYTSKLGILDQSESIGKFLDKTVAIIKTIIKHYNVQVNLYINGKRFEQIKNISSYNQEKIPATIVRSCVFQDKTPYQDFVKKQDISDPLVFSLSYDLVEGRDILKKYIFFMGKDKRWSLKDRLRNLFFFEHENLYGMGSLDSIEYSKNQDVVRKTVYYYRLKSKIRRNERLYERDASVVCVNDLETSKFSAYF